jgi:hypothetical protein
MDSMDKYLEKHSKNSNIKKKEDKLELIFDYFLKHTNFFKILIIIISTIFIFYDQEIEKIIVMNGYLIINYYLTGFMFYICLNFISENISFENCLSVSFMGTLVLLLVYIHPLIGLSGIFVIIFIINFFWLPILKKFSILQLFLFSIPFNLIFIFVFFLFLFFINLIGIELPMDFIIGLIFD